MSGARLTRALFGNIGRQSASRWIGLPARHGRTGRNHLGRGVEGQVATGLLDEPYVFLRYGRRYLMHAPIYRDSTPRLRHGRWRGTHQ